MSLDEIASWVIVDKVTGNAACELYDIQNVFRINTLKYKAVPILMYLQSLNRCAA